MCDYESPQHKTMRGLTVISYQTPLPPKASSTTHYQISMTLFPDPSKFGMGKKKKTNSTFLTIISIHGGKI